MTPFKNLKSFGYDISQKNVSGYKNFHQDKINIIYLRVNTEKNIQTQQNIFKDISKAMQLFIALFGPIGIGVNSHNISFETRNVNGNQYYSYQESNNDTLKWYNGELSDQDFNNKYSNQKTTHAVEIVGWTPANQKSGRQCWIVKNSWGELWGNHGYFLIPIGINAHRSEIHPDLLIHVEFLSEKFKKSVNKFRKLLNQNGNSDSDTSQESD